MSNSTSQFSAADSALGYFYQARCALLWSLQRLISQAQFQVSLETLDDVTFESSGIPHELLQTKLHKNRGANLTDASTDLWKTLRVWIEAMKSGMTDSKAIHYLLTTENAAEGSIAANLKVHNRDIDAAISGLDSVAMSSVSQQNAKAFAAYLSLSVSDKRILLDRIIIIDAAPDIQDLDTLVTRRNIPRV